MLANVEDINKFVSKIATYHTNRFQLYVKIIDVERSRVRVSFLISPVSGTGTKWVTPKELSIITDSTLDPDDLYIAE